MTRGSRITLGTTLLFADLHNHSLLSDGDGDPDEAFAQLREAGLDVAALTDHASIPFHERDRLDVSAYPDETAVAMARGAPASLDEVGWKRTAELADAADEPGRFTALRGFEWTEPWLGHANVWFSEGYLSVHPPGRLDTLHRWLREEEGEALFGYNHPGREPGRFAGYTHDPALTGRMVGLEMFNRYDDYLFTWDGEPSPLLACLRAGWRPGLLGVSDEHGREYGLAGKGRTGLWAREHSRAGVREALLARRTYATREQGLRLDATLDGRRMGRDVPAAGTHRLVVDLDAPHPWAGTAVSLQLLGDRGDAESVVLATLPARVGAVTSVDLRGLDSAWVVLRVADEERPAVPRRGGGRAASGYALAYASPWWLTPGHGAGVPVGSVG